MKRKAFALLPVVVLLVISVSGCTGISSIDSLFGSFCIPGLTCGSTQKDTADVLIISTLDANPSTVSTGQQFRLSAWIINKGQETVPQKLFKTSSTFPSNALAQYVRVKIFDSCEGLFKKIETTCPSSSAGKIEDSKAEAGWGCYIKSILPGESVPVTWTITAEDASKVPLEIPCNIKVAVDYPYQTTSTTTFAFVDYTELQRMKDSGTAPTTSSDVHLGPGPIKPYLLSEDSQPIPVANGDKDAKTTVSFQIKNEGTGFLSYLYLADEKGNLVRTDSSASGVKGYMKIAPDDIKVQSNPTAGGYQMGAKISDALKPQTADGLQLVGKESPKIYLSVAAPYDNKIEKIATYPVTATISYMYEFRKEVKVTVKPPPIKS